MPRGGSARGGDWAPAAGGGAPGGDIVSAVLVDAPGRAVAVAEVKVAVTGDVTVVTVTRAVRVEPGAGVGVGVTVPGGTTPPSTASPDQLASVKPFERDRWSNLSPSATVPSVEWPPPLFTPVDKSGAPLGRPSRSVFCRRRRSAVRGASEHRHVRWPQTLPALPG